MFTGRALLPGDYLMQMAPWNAAGGHVSASAQWNPLQWDAIAQFYPWRVFYAHSMRHGKIPLWNPHQFCGTPFLANGQSAVLYPPNLLFLVFDPITAFTLLAVLHLFLAAAFSYMLLRRLGASELAGIVSGTAFAFCAFMVLWLELPTFIGVAVWLPLVLLLIDLGVERGSVFFGMLSGGALAMAFLAGHFQIAFYVAFAAVLWWLWKLAEVWRRDGKIDTVLEVALPFAGFVLIAGLLGAPQILPTQELSAASHRVRAVTPEGYQKFQSNALPAYRLITAVAPDFFGNPSRGNYTLLGRQGDHVGSAADYIEYGMYVGIVALVLAFLGLARVRRRRHVGFFAALGLIALLSAAGTPINKLFYFGIPGFSALGGPNRILLLYLFSVAVLAGFGADWLAQLCQRWISRPVFAVVVIALVAADLFAFGINYNPTCERSKVYPETKLTKELERIAGHDRIAPINPSWSLFQTPNAILPPNAAMVYGLYDVQGYDSLYTKDYKDLSSEIQGEDSSPVENGNMVLMRRYTPQISRLARYVVTRDELNDQQAQRLQTVEGVNIYKLVGRAAVATAAPAYQPFAFRLGLFMMLVGVGMLSMVGVFRRMRYNGRLKKQ